MDTICPWRSVDILGGLCYSIGIEVNGYDVGLATLGGHEGDKSRACTHIQDASAVLHTSPCPE